MSYEKFYFSGKRQRKSTKNVSKTCHWKLIFVIWSYSAWALRHARHVSTSAHKASQHVNTQGTLAREHAKHVGTWARKHGRHVGVWARKARWHVRTWARKHRRHVGTWACKHASHIGTWARKIRNLADSEQKWWIADGNTQAKVSILASLAKWLSVRLRTKWLWVQTLLPSLKLQKSHLFRARSSLTFRQL